MYIGIISDTHSFVDPRVKEFLSPVDELWHAGDFGCIETADELAAFKPLKGVYGNCDGAEVRSDYPPVQLLEVEGRKILMTHIGGYPGKYDRKALQLIEGYRPDIFVCGHSHILKVMNDKRYNMLVLNPGAAGTYGFHQVQTALRFKIEQGRIFDMEVGQWEFPDRRK